MYTGKCDYVGKQRGCVWLSGIQEGEARAVIATRTFLFLGSLLNLPVPRAAVASFPFSAVSAGEAESMNRDETHPGISSPDRSGGFTEGMKPVSLKEAFAGASGAGLRGREKPSSDGVI